MVFLNGMVVIIIMLSNNKIVGFTCGTFDLCHPGHLVMFEQCKKHCDYLIVGLHSDPSLERSNKNKPIQTIFERYTQLKSCKFIDEIIPYDTELDLCNMIYILDINKRFLSEEYINTDNTAQDICKYKNIELIFLERKHSYSSSDLRNRLK